MSIDHMKSLPQWVLSKIVMRGGKKTKPPYQINGKRASVTNPEHWVTYAEAKAASTDRLPYVGFVLTNNDPYAIIDLDAPKDEKEASQHAKIIEKFDCYTEKSISKKGTHIIVEGVLPKGVHNGNIEMYSQERYMIYTGDVLHDKPIALRQKILNDMYKHLKSKDVKTDYVDAAETTKDSDLLNMAVNAENGTKFDDLYNGRWQQHGFQSQSEADSSLITMLGFYSKNEAQVIRLFKQSALYRPQMSNKQEAYIAKTLRRAKAIEPPPIDLSKITEPKPILPPIVDYEPDWPPGLVGEIAKYIYESAPMPSKIIAIAASLALFSGICGRAYSVSGTGCGQYIILLAPTGYGKDAMKKGIERIMRAMAKKNPAIYDYKGPGTFSSGQALTKQLSKRPCFVSILGEFGQTLKIVCSAKASDYTIKFKSVLLDVYTSSGPGAYLDATSKADDKDNVRETENPSLTILGESNPESFYSTINETHIAEGLLSRFTVLEHTGPRPKRNHKSGQQPHESLIWAMSEIFSTVLKTERPENGSGPGNIAIGGIDELYFFAEETDRYMDEAQDEKTRNLWSRAYVKALKIAGVIAVGEGHERPQITPEGAKYAADLVRGEIKALERRYDSGEQGNGSARCLNVLKRVFSDYSTTLRGTKISYGVNDAKLLKNKNVVPYCYLSNRLLKIQPFVENGTMALKLVQETIKEAVNMGILQIVPPGQAQNEFETRHKLYVKGYGWN